MVQFSNTSADPKTVMVVLPDTFVTLPTVLSSIGLLNVANFTKSFGGELEMGNMLNACNSVFKLCIGNSIYTF